MTGIYKRPSSHNIYWALEDVRRAEKRLFGPAAYRFVTRDANTVADDMARRALQERGDVIYWYGDVPADAPANQLADVYKQQGAKPQLHWADLPDAMDWQSVSERLGIASVSAIFGDRCAGRVAAISCER